MDQNTINEMLDQLSQRRAGEKLKLILSIKETLSKRKDLVPEEFSSRVDFRKALIDRKLETVEDGIREALTKFKKIGLVATANPITSTVIVEGNVEQLLKALVEDDVQSASFDEKIELIRPVEE